MESPRRGSCPEANASNRRGRPLHALRQMHHSRPNGWRGNTLTASDMSCRSAAPRQTQQGKGANDPVADVDLPPAQAVPGRGREGVVVVMPPFPQREDTEEKIVPTVIVGPERSVAPQVADRVDTPRHMMD